MSGDFDRWSDAKIKLLGYLWHVERLSNAKIAEQMNEEYPGSGYSSNMIAGKRHLLHFNTKSREIYDAHVAAGFINDPHEQAWTITSETERPKVDQKAGQNLKSDSVLSAKSQKDFGSAANPEPAPPVLQEEQPSQQEQSLNSKTAQAEEDNAVSSAGSVTTSVQPNPEFKQIAESGDVKKYIKAGKASVKTGHLFVSGDMGVCAITAITNEEVSGYSLDTVHTRSVFGLIVQPSLLRKTPEAKFLDIFKSVPSSEEVLRAYETVFDQAKSRRIIWSRKEQAYEAQIASSDIVSIAEVVRDIYGEKRPDQELSYSEKNLAEKALHFLAEVISVKSGESVGTVFSELEDLVASRKKVRMPWKLEDVTAVSDKEFEKLFGHKKGGMPTRKVINLQEGMREGAHYTL